MEITLKLNEQEQELITVMCNDILVDDVYSKSTKANALSLLNKIEQEYEKHI